MSQKIQLRRDTAANWTTTNPTLSAGEFGVETDTLKVKVGNGSTAWTALAYIAGGSSVTKAAVIATGLAAADIGADAAGAAATAQATALSGAATDATSKANAAQAAAVQRANHTGTQAATTITGLATVATTGAYTDLSGKPTLGTAAAQATSAFDAAGAASTAQTAAQTYADTGDALAAKKAANLSDLASAPTARTNLGLGGAATLAVGTTTGTVAAGDDSRIVNAIPASQKGAASGVATLTAAGLLAQGAGYDQRIQAYGLTEANTRYSRAAVARTRAGTDDFRFFGIGDSISIATGATGSAFANGWQARFGSTLAARVGLTSRQGIIRPGQGAGLPAEFTLGTGWSRQTGFPGLPSGGGTAQANAAAAGTLDFTPTVPCDSFIVYWGNGGSANGFSWAVDAGGATNVAAVGGSLVVAATTISAGTVGTHTLHIGALATGGTAYIIGVEAVNSTARGFRFSGDGQNGWTSAQMVINLGSSTSTTATEISAAKPDLVVIPIGVNDYLNGTITPTTTQSNVTTMVQAIQSFTRKCDVCLLVEPPNSTTAANAGGFTQANYNQALYNVADATGCFVIDIYKRWGTYALSQATPLSLYSDGTHPNDAGYWDMGSALAAVVATLV